MTREAAVRFYVDADLLGLAKTLSLLRADVTYPGDPGGRIRKRIRPPCPVTSPATKDREWIPIVTQHGWVILTRDSRIQEHRAEIDAVRSHGARMIVLAGKKPLTPGISSKSSCVSGDKSSDVVNGRVRSSTPPRALACEK